MFWIELAFDWGAGDHDKGKTKVLYMERERGAIFAEHQIVEQNQINWVRTRENLPHCLASRSGGDPETMVLKNLSNGVPHIAVVVHEEDMLVHLDPLVVD